MPADPALSAIDSLAAELDRLRGTENDLKNRLDDIRRKQAEVQRRIVLQRRGWTIGQTMRHETGTLAGRLEPLDASPWLRVRLLRKDGTLGGATRPVYGDCDEWRVDTAPCEAPVMVREPVSGLPGLFDTTFLLSTESGLPTRRVRLSNRN